MTKRKFQDKDINPKTGEKSNKAMVRDTLLNSQDYMTAEVLADLLDLTRAQIQTAVSNMLDFDGYCVRIKTNIKHKGGCQYAYKLESLTKYEEGFFVCDDDVLKSLMTDNCFDRIITRFRSKIRIQMFEYLKETNWGYIRFDKMTKMGIGHVHETIQYLRKIGLIVHIRGLKADREMLIIGIDEKQYAKHEGERAARKKRRCEDLRNANKTPRKKPVKKEPKSLMSFTEKARNVPRPVDPLSGWGA